MLKAAEMNERGNVAQIFIISIFYKTFWNKQDKRDFSPNYAYIIMFVIIYRYLWDLMPSYMASTEF